jgi:hypothetical protein
MSENTVQESSSTNFCIGDPTAPASITSTSIPVTQTVEFPNISTVQGPPKPYRSEGFVNGVTYFYKSDGSVDWREMVNPAHIVVNKEVFKKQKLPLPASIEGLDDSYLLIKLAGIKEVAKLRGYEKVSYQVLDTKPGYVSVKCSIKWIPNSHEPYPIKFEEIANASVENVTGFAAKFLETIAVNRSFSRCVRNFLNIHIVADEEIGPEIINSESKDGGTIPGPRNLLIEAVKEKLGYEDFESFQSFISEAKKLEVYDCKNSKNWKTWDDIPVKECRFLLTLVKEKQ